MAAACLGPLSIVDLACKEYANGNTNRAERSALLSVAVLPLGSGPLDLTRL